MARTLRGIKDSVTGLTETSSNSSDSTDLAETFGADVRRLIQARWHRALFPRLALDKRKASLQELRTTQNGMRYATSVGGTLTGKGCDVLIVDDPMKAEDAASETRRDATYDWFTGTAMTRLDNPKTGAVIVVAQRLHDDDLPGRMINTGDWEVLELPAIATKEQDVVVAEEVTWTRKPGEVLLPNHMGRDELEQKQREIGTQAFEAQYQQSPVIAGGSIIRTEWFGVIPEHLRRGDYEAVLQSWDVAAVPGESNDYSVCTTWGLLGNSMDLLDVHRAQYLQPDLVKVAVKLREKWNPNMVVVETTGVGRGLLDHLRRHRRDGVRAFHPRLGKDERMSVESLKIESGEVRLPQNASWKETFLAETAAFPNGKYDDQVDSLSQALACVSGPSRELCHCSRFKGKMGRVLK